MFVFLENNRDNLEQIRKQIADIKEKLDTLMNRLPLQEKKLRMEGKISFFSGGGSFFKSRQSKLGKRYLSVPPNNIFLFIRLKRVIYQHMKNVSRLQGLSYSWCETTKINSDLNSLMCLMVTSENSTEAGNILLFLRDK